MLTLLAEVVPSYTLVTVPALAVSGFAVTACVPTTVSVLLKFTPLLVLAGPVVPSCQVPTGVFPAPVFVMSVGVSVKVAEPVATSATVKLLLPLAVMPVRPTAAPLLKYSALAIE